MRTLQRIVSGGTLLAAAAGRALAQDAPASAPIAPFTNVFITAGTAYANIGNLNQRFATTNYDALSGHGYSIGGGGYVPFGRALFGAEYHDTDFGFESTASGRVDKMHGDYWMATAGMAFVTTWRFNVVGYLGVGMGTTKLTVSDRVGGPTVGTSADPLFDDILNSPGSASTITGTYTLFQPAVGVDYLMLRSDKSHVGVTFGIRIGTTVSPHLTHWSYEGRDVVGAPDAGPVGTFVRLTLGVGGFRLLQQ